MAKTVYIDPDGTADAYTYLIVPMKSGVAYVNQIGGILHDERILEGYLDPIGDQIIAGRIFDWFWDNFFGQSYRFDWSAERLNGLQELINLIPSWDTNDPSDPTMKKLRLDRQRVSEITEGWIPVISARGPCILVLKNSDRERSFSG